LTKDVSFKDLKSSIAKAKADFPTIHKSLTSKRQELQSTIRNYIHDRDTFIINETHNWLVNSVDIPHLNTVKQYLIQEANVTMKSGNEYLAKELLLLKNDIDLWVEENLNKVSNQVEDNSQYQVDLSNLNNFVVENLTDFHVAIGLVNFGLLAIIAVEFPPVAIILAIFSLLGWASTATERRQKHINKIMDAVREQNAVASNKIAEKYDEIIAKNIFNLYKYGEDRMNVFLNDIEKEIIKNDAKPISNETRSILESNLKQLGGIKSDILELDRKIKLEFF
jgi:hypothetical protein